MVKNSIVFDTWYLQSKFFESGDNMQNLSKVILGTGNYYDVKSGNTVSVTGDGGNAWGYFGQAYKKLAPKLVTYTPYSEKLEELER